MTFLRPYPSYKPSGVPWLGDVPEHWGVAAIKRHFAIRLGKMLQTRSIGADDSETPYLKAKHVQWFSVHSVDPPMMWASPHDVEQYGIAEGDLLVCEGGEGGRSGVARAVPPSCIIQNALHRVRPRGDSLNGFLQYVMSAVSSTGWFDATNNRATIAHFTKDKFGSLDMPVPQPDEQSAIVRYLDFVDRRIRKYIRAKQKLIALLNEQKQAIIHQAVTGQIDVRTGKPYPKYKPSGVPWLGEIPEDWRSEKVKHLARTGYKTFVDGNWIESPYITADGVRLIQTGNIGVGSYREQGFRYISDRTFSDFNCTPVVHGDILICRLGEPVGRACLAPDLGCKMITSVDVCILKVGVRASPAYLVYTLNSRQYLAWVGSLVRGSTRDRVSRSMLGSFAIPLPSWEAQAGIVEFIASATDGLEKAASCARREADLLREYRTRLVADVVTGKLDVREAAANLPDEPDEAEEPELPDGDEAEESDEEVGSGVVEEVT